MSDKKFVFVSRPTRVGEVFERAYEGFHAFLNAEGFEARRLGQSDYSRKAPLQAVMDIIDECCGAVVLGYPQLELLHEVRRSSEVQDTSGYIFPTPWNQIEGALAFRARTPVMVIAHKRISGGVFDHGVTGEGVLHLDLAKTDWFQQPEFSQPYVEWRNDVRKCLKAERGADVAVPRHGRKKPAKRRGKD